MTSLILPALFVTLELHNFTLTPAAVPDYLSLFGSERGLPWTQGQPAAAAVPQGDGRLP